MIDNTDTSEEYDEMMIDLIKETCIFKVIVKLDRIFSQKLVMLTIRMCSRGLAPFFDQKP